MNITWIKSISNKLDTIFLYSCHNRWVTVCVAQSILMPSPALHNQLWRHQNRPNEALCRCVKVVFLSFMGSSCRIRNEMMYVLPWRTVSVERYFGVYLPHCFASREINTKITLSWVHKQVACLAHTLFPVMHSQRWYITCPIFHCYLSTWPGWAQLHVMNRNNLSCKTSWFITKYGLV